MSGYSYQEIDTRLRVVEDLITFIAKNMRGKVIVHTGVVDPNGEPVTRVIDGSLLEIYQLAQQAEKE